MNSKCFWISGILLSALLVIFGCKKDEEKTVTADYHRGTLYGVVKEVKSEMNAEIILEITEKNDVYETGTKICVTYEDVIDISDGDEVKSDYRLKKGDKVGISFSMEDKESINKKKYECTEISLIKKK
ncbi:MAG: hypothetical protein K6G64_07205 [Eubacterium sp.]|nr:hypothetical protein [Eubacterium sp.]